MQDDDRRRHPRVRVDGRAAGRATIFADFRVVALSATGAAVEMDIALAVGSLCDLTLNLKQGQVDAWGKVAAVEPAGSRYRVTVDFVRIDDADQPALQAYLAGQGGGGA